jgi:hypothetical protein
VWDMIGLDSFTTAHAATHIEMCPHEQRCRPPPLGGESEGGIKGKGDLLQGMCEGRKLGEHSDECRDGDRAHISHRLRSFKSTLADRWQPSKREPWCVHCKIEPQLTGVTWRPLR